MTIKAHANGIKKARDYSAKSLKGVSDAKFPARFSNPSVTLENSNPLMSCILSQMDPKFLRNLRMSKKHNKKAKKDE